MRETGRLPPREAEKILKIMINSGARPGFLVRMIRDIQREQEGEGSRSRSRSRSHPRSRSRGSSSPIRRRRESTRLVRSGGAGEAEKDASSGSQSEVAGKIE
jgi:hypothetical protein